MSYLTRSERIVQMCIGNTIEEIQPQTSEISVSDEFVPVIDQQNIVYTDEQVMNYEVVEITSDDGNCNKLVIMKSSKGVDETEIGTFEDNSDSDKDTDSTFYPSQPVSPASPENEEIGESEAEEENEKSQENGEVEENEANKRQAVTSPQLANQECGEIPKKRKLNKDAWKKNIKIKKRLQGKSYIGHKGITYKARPMLPAPCKDKPHKCSSLVTEESRKYVYDYFRELGSIDEQRQYILNHIERKPKKRTTRNLENSRRSFTNFYSITVNEEKVDVCREFFMATFNVTDAFIRGAFIKFSNGILQKDQRGKHVPHNKACDDDEKFIRDHILSFPAVESHYRRKSSDRRYLDASLNITIMHGLYKEKCRNENRKPFSFHKYRHVFNEFKLSFFKPKKDQCKYCLGFKNMTVEEQILNKEKHENHLKRRNLAREARDADKRQASNSDDVLAFNFDLQAVLTTPKGSAGQIFYLRKFAVYNLTTYNLGNRDAHCYLWNESTGNRGANDISSCIYKFIMNHPNIKIVQMMSDGCGGQQKNKIFAAMCLKLLQEHPNLQEIEHKFFETGHTEMECDSIHSKIEKKAKYVPVYVPEGWAQIIRCSRVNPRPFIVETMLVNDFLNFKVLSNDIIPVLPWRKICFVRYEKNVSKIFYKTNFESTFTECSLKSKRGRKSHNYTVEKAYESELPITKAKYLDLQKMCQDLTIPREHHKFYKDLNYSANIRDRLPEPNEDESESE